MTSRGTSPLTDDDLVALGQPGARGRRSGRDGDDPGSRHRRRSLRRRAVTLPDVRRTCAGRGLGARRTTRPGSVGSMTRPTPATCAVDKVLLAAPRGFCAGVEMAIKALAWMVRAFEPPVYCYHEIVHNQLVVDRFRDLGVVFVDDIAEVPAGRPIMLSAHGSAPEVVAAARRAGQLRGRRRVPAGHQGPPRGQGPGRQGLPHRLRRPRGPRGGRRHHGRGPRRHRPGRVGGRGRRPARARPTSPWPCWPRPRCPTATGRRSPSGPPSGSPTCGGRAAATCASPPPTGSRPWPRSPRAATPSSSSARPTRPTPGPSRSWPARPAATGSTGSTAPTSCPTTCTGTVGVTAGASAPEELVDAVIARLAPADGVEEVAHHRRGRVLPAAPRAARPARRRRRAGHLRPRRLGPRPPRAQRPRRSPPATCWPCSTDARRRRPPRGTRTGFVGRHHRLTRIGAVLPLTLDTVRLSPARPRRHRVGRRPVHPGRAAAGLRRAR